MKKSKAKKYENFLIRFNELLKSNNFSERFVFEDDALVLSHATDKQKKIVFVDNDGDGVILYYQSAHDHIDHLYGDSFEEFTAQIFERIKGILMSALGSNSEN